MKKKVILITGATSGIGRALSDFYYKKNYNLILTGSSTRKINNLKKIYASKALVKKVDLTNSYQVNNFVFMNC